MRIVGGKFRGRALATPNTNAIRPTTDRTRESLFNILVHNYPEKFEATRVLDLFAGTGALGLEAISRGARYGVFIEESTEGRGLIRTNVEAFGLLGNTKIFRRDAAKLGDVGFELVPVFHGIAFIIGCPVCIRTIRCRIDSLHFLRISAVAAINLL